MQSRFYLYPSFLHWKVLTQDNLYHTNFALLFPVSVREDVIHTKIFTVIDLFFLDREAVTQRCSEKNICLEISENSQEMQPEAWNFFLKKGSDTGVFLWVLGNFQEHLSLQNFSGSSFCIYADLFTMWSYRQKLPSHVFHIEETLCAFQKIPRENIWDDVQYLRSSSLQVFVTLCCRGFNGNFSKIIKVAISENISGRLIRSNKKYYITALKQKSDLCKTWTVVETCTQS